jgi:hypothetical protein
MPLTRPYCASVAGNPSTQANAASSTVLGNTVIAQPGPRKVELGRVTGQTLNRNNISTEEAWIGIRR